VGVNDLDAIHRKRARRVRTFGALLAEMRCGKSMARRMVTQGLADAS
jgi:hypothetical protein